MKNAVAARRFFAASLIISITIPLGYHSIINYTRRDYYQNLTKEVCKAVEPDVQLGAQRKPIEYAQGMMLRQGFDHNPSVAFFDHEVEVTPHRRSSLGDFRVDCNFAGIPAVRMSITYQLPSLLNFNYVYLYILSIPLFFGIFVLIRRQLDKFQKQVVDLVQGQIKNLLGAEVQIEKPKGFLGLLDLNIPLLGYLKTHIDGLEGKLADYSNKIAEQKKVEVLADVAAQMAHDIVAPISTLQSIISTTDSFKNQDLIREELERMRGLAEKMLRQYRGESPSAPEIFNIIPIVNTVANEARTLAGNKCEIDLILPSIPAMAHGSKSDVASALANILKNAFESIDHDSGKISMRLELGAAIKIAVADNGCGISESNLETIFGKRVSYKLGGTGLGLYQAKETVRSMGGHIHIRSIVGQGTTVEMEIPLIDQRMSVAVPPGAALVFLDDDKMIHQIWKKQIPSSVPSFFFGDVAEFSRWTKDNKEAVYFIDHDLSGDESGIDIIEERRLQKTAYLVTGRAHEPAITNKCAEKGIRLLSKDRIPSVTFGTIEPLPKLVFIDDLHANRVSWEVQAKLRGRVIKTFSSPDEFKQSHGHFDRSTEIYIDYLFHGEPIKPEVVKEILDLGFTKVMIATALAPTRVKVPPGILRIVGKEFPADV